MILQPQVRVERAVRIPDVIQQPVYDQVARLLLQPRIDAYCQHTFLQPLEHPYELRMLGLVAGRTGIFVPE
jgi:hypothetical protein